MRAAAVRHDGLVRWAGAALAAGGVLTALINAFLTPAVATGQPFAVTAATPVFLWRQAASALAAALLLFGSVGLHLRQAGRAGGFGAAAFALAFLGSALLLASEWAEVFLVRTLALRAPEALRALDAGPGPSPYDLGSIAALATFTLGWIALAAATIRAGMLSRRAAALVIVGLFSIPLLHPVLPGVWGAAVGNAILGAGWLWLGLDLRRPVPAEAA